MFGHTKMCPFFEDEIMKCKSCGNTMKRVQIETHKFEYECPNCGRKVKTDTHKNVSRRNDESQNNE